ncbi:zinc ABC transporter substrate-binding protein [Puniceicoccaceae bacterium K14]|nr:zinc ABC transporter substrate-binding protein [Puniceicoccaceae bacterium K14]
MNFGRRYLLAIVLFAIGFVSPIAAKLQVVTTTSHVADLVANVAGDRVELKSLMGPGVDPHLYKATARDVMTLQRADLVFYSGWLLEGRLTDTLEKMKSRGKVVHAVAEKVSKEKLLSSEDYVDHYDPHTWFDPELWATTVEVVVEALSELDAENANTYKANGEEYRKQILDLAEWTKAKILEIPESRRFLVTSHDAYNYFGRAFGIQVIGVQGLSTATEAGLADVSKTVDFIKKNEIPAIFVESSVSPATINSISKQSGAVVGGELFSDALGAPGETHTISGGVSYEVGTYIGMFKYNVDTIVNALK